MIYFPKKGKVMRYIACAIAVLGLLAGCVRPQQTWTRAESSNPASSRDNYECQRDARQALAEDPRTRLALDSSQSQNSGPFGALARTIAGADARSSAEQVYVDCMRREVEGALIQARS